jgi:hypothetical protein
VSYVDAGYAAALSTLLVYALSLVVRRRRWERAFETSQPSALPAPSDPSEPSEPSRPEAVPASGERS